jgi:acetylglutamate kinase
MAAGKIDVAAQLGARVIIFHGAGSARSREMKMADHRLSFGYIAFRKGPQQMLTAAQQYSIDRFAKSLCALSDDALIDTYHQAAEDNRAARAEGSDNLSKAHAQTLAAEKAMRDRFHDYRTRYNVRYP